tara:strand:- start:472 stop:1863 length:1392 start_codon:yes stop_codon:yes gene_type:complete
MARLGQKSTTYRSRYRRRIRGRQRYSNTTGLRAASGTYLGITGSRVAPAGVPGPPGPVGATADAFQIKQIYNSYAELQADTSKDHGTFGMIAGTLSEANEDYGKLYYFTNDGQIAGWSYVTDMSIQGVAGESVLSGTGAPSASLGKNGDKYLDVTSGNPKLYAAKTNGAWPALGTSLKGPQGPTGDPGTQGGTWTGNIDMDSYEVQNANITTAESIEVDNLTLDGNTIETTGSNDLVINPGGLASVNKIDIKGEIDLNENTISEVDGIDFSADPTGITFPATGSVAIKKCFDEDDMASDDVEAVATQQSIKAYVDSKTQKYGHLMILPSDWMPSDASSTYNLGIYDFNSSYDSYGAPRAMSSYLELFAYKELPKGYKATSIDIWVNHKLAADSSTLEVYEKFWNNTAPVSKGSVTMTGNAGSALYQLNFTDITASGSNMIMLRIDPANTIAKFLGAKIYITEV